MSRRHNDAMLAGKRAWEAKHTAREIHEMRVLDVSYLMKDAPENAERRLRSEMKAFDALYSPPWSNVL